MQSTPEKAMIVRTAPHPALDRFPELAKRLAEADLPNGRRTLAAVRRPADAKTMAKIWLGDRIFSPSSLIVHPGLGDGWSIERILQRVPQGSFLFVGEKDPDLLAAVLEGKGSEKWCHDPRLLLAAGELDDAFFACLDGLPLLEIKEVEHCIYSPLYNRDEAWHGRFLAQTVQYIDGHRKLLHTQLADGAFWQRNTLLNLPVLLNSPSVSALRDLGRDLPVILVSAGPSLDESLEWLREVANHAILIVLNSAYRAVRRAGIIPHLTLAADPRRFTALGYQGEPIDGVFLACPWMVHPTVAAAFAGRTFTWSTNNPLVDFVLKNSALPASPEVLEIGTTAACAFDLVEILGSQRLCLVGQDLSVRPDGQSHTRESFYEDSGNNRVDISRCRWLPGNTTGSVPVEEKLFVYWQTFQRILNERPHLEVINTSQWGARLDGAPYFDFDQARTWIGRNSSLSIPSQLETRASPENGPLPAMDKCRAALSKLYEFARKTSLLSTQAALHCQRLPTRMSAANYAKASSIREAGLYALRVNQWLDRHEEEYKVLFAGKTSHALALFKLKREQIHAPQAHWRDVLHNREYFWALAEGANSLLYHLHHWSAVYGDPKKDGLPSGGV